MPATDLPHGRPMPATDLLHERAMPATNPGLRPGPA